MMKWTNGVLAAALGIALVGCSKSEATKATPDMMDAAAASAMTAPTGDAGAKATMAGTQANLRKATIAVFLANPQAELTPAVEEALLLDFDGRDLGARAPAVQMSDTNWKTGEAHPHAAGMAEDGPRLQALAAKHLTDPSDGVRDKSMDLWEPVLADDAGDAAFLAAATKETSPDILRHLMPMLLGDLKTNADVRALVLKSADSASPDLRRAAVGALLDPRAEDLEGAFEKVQEKLASDPSEDVRYQACVHLYGTHDARAVPLFDKYLSDPATPDSLYRGCWVGLQLAWLPVFAEDPPRPSADAFKLTVASLEKTPRTETRPPSAIEHIADAPVHAHADETSTAKSWRAVAKTFLDVPRLTKALEAVALDPAAGGDARLAAEGDLKAIGESPAKLASIRAAIVQMDKKP